MRRNHARHAEMDSLCPHHGFSPSTPKIVQEVHCATSLDSVSEVLATQDVGRQMPPEDSQDCEEQCWRGLGESQIGARS